MGFPVLAKAGFELPASAADERHIAANDGSRMSGRTYYDSASRGRLTGSWYAPDTGPNRAVCADHAELLRRSREVCRNVGWVRQALARSAGQEVGQHIIPIFKNENKEIAKEFRAHWDNFVRHADADGVLSFYGLLVLAAYTRRMAGECFIRFRPRRKAFGIPVPLQLQFLESEMVPIHLNRILPNGNVIRHGVEFNRMGQRVAYHIYTQHPYDTSPSVLGFQRTVRVSARLILHHYKPTRPGQIRAEPETSAALFDAFNYKEYLQAEAIRKKARANHTAFVETPDVQYDDDDVQYDKYTGKKLDGSDSSSTIEPGMYNVLLPGEKIKLLDGDNTGQGYSDYQRWVLLGMSSSLETPYQITTGDLEGMNDRLWKAITNEWYNGLDLNREHLIIHQICNPTADMFSDILWLNNLVDIPDYQENRVSHIKRTWQPQARRFLNAKQEMEALKIEKDEGFASPSSIAARLGKQQEQTDDEIADDADRREDLGLPNIKDKKKNGK